jgi:hypothetical protein
MRGRDFLNPARRAAAGTEEADWRAAAIHAYYALFLECREGLLHWGLPNPPRHNAHADVRLRFIYAGDTDLRNIGDVLKKLGRLRNPASYNLSALPEFANNARGKKAIQDAENALALLDAIEAAPSRRAAAIASIRP